VGFSNGALSGAGVELLITAHLTFPLFVEAEVFFVGLISSRYTCGMTKVWRYLYPVEEWH
jgi:hypothetical protein